MRSKKVVEENDFRTCVVFFSFRLEYDCSSFCFPSIVATMMTTVMIVTVIPATTVVVVISATTVVVVISATTVCNKCGSKINGNETVVLLLGWGCMRKKGGVLLQWAVQRANGSKLMHAA